MKNVPGDKFVLPLSINALERLETEREKLGDKTALVCCLI